MVAQTNEGQDVDMIDCVAGLIFLGTPFTAPRAQSYAKVLGNILGHFDRGSSKIYETSPRELRQQRRDFVRIVNRQHIPLYCFFEQHKSNIGRIIDPRIDHNVSPAEPEISCSSQAVLIGKKAWLISSVRQSSLMRNRPASTALKDWA